MDATWDEESGFKEDSDNEEAILCFMAIEKKVMRQNLKYDDLQLAFEKLHDEMEKTLKKHKF